MSRFLSWCGLLVVVLNFTGYYLFVLVQLHTHVESRDARLTAPGRTRSFVLPAQVFNTIKLDDHEFRLDNNLYDIVSSRVDGELVYLVAIPDAFEDELLTLLQALTDAGPLEDEAANLLEHPDSFLDDTGWTVTSSCLLVQHHTPHRILMPDVPEVVAGPPPWPG